MRVAKLLKKSRLQSRNSDFDDLDPIPLSAFFKELRDAYDSIGIYERVAAWLFFWFKRKTALSSSKVRLSIKKIYLRELHYEKFSQKLESSIVC